MDIHGGEHPWENSALAVEVATVTVALRLPLKGFLVIVAGGILIWVLIEILKHRREAEN
jgi:chromate transport protein ChrA